MPLPLKSFPLSLCRGDKDPPIVCNHLRKGCDNDPPPSCFRQTVGAGRDRPRITTVANTSDVNPRQGARHAEHQSHLSVLTATFPIDMGDVVSTPYHPTKPINPDGGDLRPAEGLIGLLKEP
jgi:hypothetical protein